MVRNFTIRLDEPDNNWMLPDDLLEVQERQLQRLIQLDVHHTDTLLVNFTAKCDSLRVKNQSQVLSHRDRRYHHLRPRSIARQRLRLSRYSRSLLR